MKDIENLFYICQIKNDKKGVLLVRMKVVVHLLFYFKSAKEYIYLSVRANTKERIDK